MVIDIFQALSIDTEEDIHLLASYFMHLKGKPEQEDGEGEFKVQLSNIL